MKKLFTLFVAALAVYSVANAQLAYNQTFAQTDFDNVATVVAKDGDIAWDNANGIRLGGSSTSIMGSTAWNWNEKYVVIALEAGKSISLSFTTGVTSGASTKGSGRFWYVAAGATQDNLTTIWTETDKNNPGVINLDLDESVRFVKICFNGNFAGYVKNLTVVGLKEVTTYGEYAAAFCEGDSIEYNGVWYKEAFAGDVTLTEKNHLGFDSIVNLTVSVYPTFSFEEEQIVMTEGEELFWHDMDLAQLMVGDTVLYDTLTTKHGCDSVMYVSVIVMQKEEGPTTAVENATHYAPCTKQLINGQLYIRREDALFDLRGNRVE